MRFLTEAIAVLVVGAIIGTLAGSVINRPPHYTSEGELRCQGAGGVIIKVGGKDYAVNAMAGPGYPPIQSIWNETTFPRANIDRLIVRGLTFCDWETASHN
jgi:hypothetical protein